MNLAEIGAAVRDIVDFPKPGIIYKDITPLLHSPDLFSEIIDRLAAKYQDDVPDYIAGIESRGFIFGAALAYRLGCGFIPVRKAGKLPYKTISASYQLEYGSATIDVHEDAAGPGDTILLLDDLLATGGTAAAAAGLLERLGAVVIGIEFVIELEFLKGRAKLLPYKVGSLIVN